MSHMRKLENDQTLVNEANYRNWTHRWQSHLDILDRLAVGLPFFHQDRFATANYSAK